jgi:putative flippase GtrA
MNSESKNKLIRYLKYCIAGGIGIIIDFSLFTVFVKFFQINYLVANIFSISVALILVYYLQKNWTFQYQIKEQTKTFQRYLVSVALTYLFNNGVLVIFVQLLRFDVIHSKIIQIILSTVLGYILTNYFVFVKKDEVR